MFAIIRTGGKQYRVSPKQVLKIEKLPDTEGKAIFFKEVLLVSDGKRVDIGMPFVEGARVEGKIRAHGKAKKVIVFRYKSKTRYRKKKGHRQPYTEVEITKITTTKVAKESKAAKVSRVAKATKEAKAAKSEKPKAKLKAQKPAQTAK